MNTELRQQIAKAGFKVSKEAADFCGLLKTRFGFLHNNEAARLCIGRSLSESTSPPPQDANRECIAPIRGENLFGLDAIDVWICLVIEGGGFGAQLTASDFRATVEAHWERGALRLRDEWEESKGDDIQFLSRIADFLPEGRPGSDGAVGGTGDGAVAGAVAVPLGPTSTLHPSNEPIAVTVNAQGVAPHIALMGKNGSGKTWSGTFIAGRIHAASGAPILLLDPKGEFVDEGVVRPDVARAIPGIQGIELGRGPVPLDFLPDQRVGDVGVTQAAMRFRDSLARCFRMSGDIQQNNLRQAVEDVIRSGGRRDLPAIQQTYLAIATATGGKSMDSVISKLDELSALQLFNPAMSPEDFFRRSWVIGMKSLQADEVKRLAILLILDALAAHVLAQPDSPAPDGFRQLRHILFIDEARRILSEKKYQSLVDLLRWGRSKGELVMLISQDPSDFDGQAEDFTAQLGTVLAFQCNANRGLKALQGAYQRKIQPAEFSDSQLPAGVAFAKLPGRQAERVRCWTPG